MKLTRAKIPMCPECGAVCRWDDVDGRYYDCTACNRRLIKHHQLNWGYYATAGGGAVARRMDGQDNRCTAHPIFVVQERKRVYGLHLDYTDKFVWVSVDEGSEVTGDEEAELEAEYEHTGIEPEMYIRTGYVDMWEWVQPFFSERGARRYVEANKHHLTEPRVYVASGHRNDEWQIARAVLADNKEQGGGDEPV